MPWSWGWKCLKVCESPFTWQNGKGFLRHTTPDFVGYLEGLSVAPNRDNSYGVCHEVGVENALKVCESPFTWQNGKGFLRHMTPDFVGYLEGLSVAPNRDNSYGVCHEVGVENALKVCESPFTWQNGKGFLRHMTPDFVGYLEGLTVAPNRDWCDYSCDTGV